METTESKAVNMESDADHKSDPDGFTHARFSAACVSWDEQPTGHEKGESYMAKVVFATLGPRYYGPFVSEEEAKRFCEAVDEYLLVRDQESHTSLLNEDFLHYAAPFIDKEG